MVSVPLAQAILFPIVVVIGTVASVHFLRGWRRTSQPSARRARLLAAGVCICLSAKYSIGLPGIWPWINEHGPVAFTGAVLVTNWLSFTVVACLVCLLLRWNYTGRKLAVRTSLALGALSITQIATTWINLANNARHSQEIADYFAWYTDPWYAFYLVTEQLVLATVLIWTMLLARRFARVAKDPWLRTGLWTTALGALLLLGQCVTWISVVIAAHYGTVLPHSELAETFTAGGAFAILIGLSLPSAVPGLRVAIERHRLNRVHRQLAPLHRLVAHLEPANQHRAITPSTDPRTQLVRRIAEIRDGLLALRAYDDPETAARLHHEIHKNGRHPDRHDSILAAARITAALARHQANQPVPQLVPSENPPDDTQPPTYDVLPHYVIGGATPEAEARWLTKVSRALDHTRK